MNVKELIAELRKLEPDLPVCWPDQSEQYLHPKLITGIVVKTGEWCDDYCESHKPADHISEYVEIG